MNEVYCKGYEDGQRDAKTEFDAEIKARLREYEEKWKARMSEGHINGQLLCCAIVQELRGVLGEGN